MIRKIMTVKQMAILSANQGNRDWYAVIEHSILCNDMGIHNTFFPKSLDPYDFRFLFVWICNVPCAVNFNTVPKLQIVPDNQYWHKSSLWGIFFGSVRHVLCSPSYKKNQNSFPPIKKKLGVTRLLQEKTQFILSRGFFGVNTIQN